MFQKSKQRLTFSQMRELRPPVPRLPFEGEITLDPISKRLRKLDNINLSKPGWSEMVYLGTNENGLENTFTQLSKYPQIAESCHVGFSSWHNFDIAAQRRSSRIIICDINPENALFLHETLRILRNSSSPQDFIAQMIAYVNENEFQTDGEGILTENVERSIEFSPNASSDLLYSEVSNMQDELRIELIRSTSWVSEMQRFNHIRNVALNDKIALLTENICATQTFGKMAKLLKENSIQIDTVYTSNIGSVLRSAMLREAFIQTLQVLSVDSIIIHANNNGLVQQIYRPASGSNEEDMRKHLFQPLPPTLSEFLATLKITKPPTNNVKVSEIKGAFYNESKAQTGNSYNIKSSLNPQVLVPDEYPNAAFSETIPSQSFT